MNRLLRTVSLIAIAASTAASAADRPLKVYILAGQSNMQGQAQKWVMPGMKADPAFKELYGRMMDENDTFRVHDNIRVAALSGSPEKPVTKTGPLTIGFGGALGGSPQARGKNAIRFGPELGFGITMHEHLNEPILIIKAAWGGKSLFSDFRPPSANEWIPPEDHPEHPDNAPSTIAIPKSFELPKDFRAPEGRGNHLQVMKGIPLDEMNGVYPIYIASVLEKRLGNKLLKKELFKQGDLILGVNGKGLKKNSVQQWRFAYFQALKNDWRLTVTRFRDGVIETIAFDIAETHPEGRAGFDRIKKAQQKEDQATTGRYYRLMVEHVRKVLADPGKYHPAYEPAQGYELAGFVWFQGWNDQADGITYPSLGHPRRFEQYSWLMSHFIRDIRAEFKTPKLPFVIGVLGVGGIKEELSPFQRAMAAPAMETEFRESVVAVQTGKFWDHKLSELHGKNKEDLTPEEQQYISNNTCSQGFHYLGSAKMFGRFGEAFANAMIEMNGGGQND